MKKKNTKPGTVGWSSQKTSDRFVLKAQQSSAADTQMGSWEIDRCLSSLPCQASTACPPTKAKQSSISFEREEEKTRSYMFRGGRIYILYFIKLGQTWPMLSMAWASCWVWTDTPCSLHNLCKTWREALVHLVEPSSSFDTSSSPEMLLFPADLAKKNTTITAYSRTTSSFMYNLAFLSVLCKKQMYGTWKAQLSNSETTYFIKNLKEMWGKIPEC